jgi:hypothetical protein
VETGVVWTRRVDVAAAIGNTTALIGLGFVDNEIESRQSLRHSLKMKLDSFVFCMFHHFLQISDPSDQDVLAIAIVVRLPIFGEDSYAIVHDLLLAMDVSISVVTLQLHQIEVHESILNQYYYC